MLTTVEAFDVQVVKVALQAGAGVAGPLNGSKVLLYTNVITPLKNTPLSALTEIAYTGYARVTPTWTPANRDTGGNISTQTSVCLFQGTGVGLPVTATGYAIVDSTGLILLALENFPAPQPLLDALSAIQFVIEWIANNPANAGGADLLP